MSADDTPAPRLHYTVPTLTPVQSGTRIGSYEIVSPLGAGGMGEVYRARDPKLGRDVAIKILPPAFTTNAERLARFDREARILAALSHPNIGAIYGLESIGASPALVLELIEGSGLDEYVAAQAPRPGPARVRLALDVARQIADALDAAHERGVVHRDLKPGNVRMTPDGVAKVLDFGLAKSHESSTVDLSNSPTISIGGTGEGVILGTAAYMSPEQARGRPIDKRTDIWAFGCLLYELLTGERPFTGETVSDLIAAILEKQPDMTRLPGATPPGIQRLIQRCLEKDPRRRLRDIGDARAELDNQSATAEQPQASSVNRRLSLPLAGLAALLVLAGITGGWFAAREATEPAPPVFDRVTRIVATAAHEHSPVLSPDSKWIAYLSNARGPADVWVKFIAGGDPANLTAGSKELERAGVTIQSADSVNGLAVSPDGTQIAFSAIADNKASTWVISAPLGGEPQHKLAEGSGLQWSPDGARIVFVQTGGSLGDALIIADADGQNEAVLVKREGAQHIHWPRWSGDGKYIYFNHGPQNFNIEPTGVFRVAATGGPIEPVITGARRAAFPFTNRDGTALVYAANPDTVDLNLWWRDLRTGRDTRLTSGVGEYTHPVLSIDGRFLVGTALDAQQSLQRVSVAFDKPAQLQPVTDGRSGDFDPMWSPDGRQLVFSSSRTGNRNLWATRGEGQPPTPLTSGRTFDERPAVSPDGRQIAFVSDRGGRRGVWVMSADGGTPRSVTTADVVDTLCWSPDGKQLAFATPRGDKPGLSVVDVASGKITPLVTPGAATGPSWSRDNVIAFVEPRGGTVGAFVQLIRPDGEPVSSVPLDQEGAARLGNGSVVWSPDGKRIAAQVLPGSGTGSLWIIDPWSPNPYRKLLDLPIGVFSRGLTWSNDGQSLILGTYRWSGDIFLAERSTTP